LAKVAACFCGSGSVLCSGISEEMGMHGNGRCKGVSFLCFYFGSQIEAGIQAL
jgi:hypothetical protein